MKVDSYLTNRKNFSGQYFGQVDFGTTQIQVFADSKKEVKRLVSEMRKAIKPPKS